MKRTLSLLLAAVLFLSMLSGCKPVSVEQEMEPAETVPESIEETKPQQTVTDIVSVPSEPIHLVISEVMPDNRNLVLGHEKDWIELYNPGDTSISLGGYALTDDLQVPDALPLSAMEISAGGYLVVTLEDDGPFGLSEVGETVYLTYKGESVNELTFSAPQNGESFDTDGVCAFSTPGYANTEEGYLSYLDTIALPELIISEVMPANGSYYPVNFYDYYDLIEVMNTTDRAISLKDYTLTDRWDGKNRYHFPDITLNPGEFYVVLCSGDPSLGQKHAGFGLAPGDTVYLARQGTYIDALPIPANLQYDESYGRSGKVPGYLDTPTPGKANTSCSVTGIAAPTADVTPGQYAEAVSVTLSGQGTIYYTTNGSRPTTYSSVYKGPITVSDVATIRAICVENGRKSPIAAFTYLIGKEHDLPVLVISTPESSIYGEKGLYVDTTTNYEFESVMTLFEDGEEKFTVPFGLRLHGNDSRMGSKKNFQLRFRSEYGVSKLNYPLFEDRDIDEFDSLLLKGGSEDWGAAMLRDELSTSLANGTTALYTQAMKPVVVYLAGMYWGVHYLRERFSDEYVASHMNVSPDSVDILASSDAYAQVGSAWEYTKLKNYVRTHDMSTAENYAYLCERIEVNSLMDWYICRTYVEDTDLANIRRFRSTEADGKWHWMYFDLDWSFYNRNYKPISDILNDVNGDRLMIQAVLASEAGRDAFLKRYAYLMSTVLNETYINARIDSICSMIASEMERDRPRWKRSVAHWESCVQELRDFASGRDAIVLRDIQRYFSLSDAEMDHYFGSLTQS